MSSDLHDAALLGDGERVKSLLAGGFDINVRDAEGQTPLYLASGAGDLAMVKLLVENGADLTAHNDEGATPLHIAAIGNNKTVVAFLLGRGADANAADGTGMTPLHLAALDGDKAIVKALLAKGADPAAQDNDGRTPIHFAQDFGHPEIVGLLQQVQLLHQLGEDDASSPIKAHSTSPAAATTPQLSPSQPQLSPSSPTKPCLKCGTPINVTAKFCGQCGTPTQAGPQTAPTTTAASPVSSPSASPAPSPTGAASNAPDALPGGTKLHSGAFAVANVLGQGGFGITYYGGDMNLHRRVAIKEFFIQGECTRHGLSIVPKDNAASANFTSAKARFLREGRTLARFDHPGIVRVYSVFEENNTVYIVMELLKGKTLMQLLESRGALPESEAVGFITKVGAALEMIHQSDLLHRDINPSNIMVCDDGRVVLIDFGLTKEIEKNTTYGTRRLSGTAVLGTASYAPLEQYSRSAQLGPPTDLYALGATLYHLLSGKVPIAATARAAGDTLQRVHEAKPGITLATSRAVAWALEMEAAQRPQSVSAFLDRLTGKASAPVPTSVPVPPSVAASSPVPAPATAPATSSVATGLAPVPVTTPTGTAIIPLPSKESYSVKVSARILEWPFACACCGERPDASFTANFTKQRGKQVIRQSTTSWQVPYCSSCLKHQQLLSDAKERLNEANQVRPVPVPIPAPVPMPTVALTPTPLTGTTVLAPPSHTPSSPPAASVTPAPTIPLAASMVNRPIPNGEGGKRTPLTWWIVAIVGLSCEIGFGLSWMGGNGLVVALIFDAVLIPLVIALHASHKLHRQSSSSQDTTPITRLPPATHAAPQTATPPPKVVLDPQASKKTLDENSARVSSLLIGGFFILPILFRLTDLAATFTNAFIAIVVIYIFVVPAVWLIFKMYYAEYNEQLEAWNKTAKARQQAQDIALDVASKKAQEEQARRQAAQDAAYQAAKKQAQDEAGAKISFLRAQAQAAVAQAQALLKPTCCDIHAAAIYERGHGSIHTFTFKSREYAQAFAELNEKKVID